MWTTVFPRTQVYQTPPSHPHHISVDKQLLPKRHTLPVLCCICLNSSLVPLCWRHSPESSVASLPPPPCWASPVARAPPAARGRLGPGSGLRARRRQLFPSAASEQVADSEGATLFLHGLQPLPCASCNFQSTGDPVGLLGSSLCPSLRHPPR